MKSLAKKAISESSGGEMLQRLAKNLSWLMDKFDVDTAMLSEATLLGTATLNSLRRGVGNPTLSTIMTLSQYFSVTITELTENDLTEQKTSLRSVKVLTLIKFHEINKFIEGKLQPNETYSVELDSNIEGNCFAVSLNNDTLVPHFSSDTIFIISEAEEPCDGDIVLLKIENHTPCFRKVFIDGDGFLFSSVIIESETFPSSYKEYKILGVILKAIKNFSGR